MALGWIWDDFGGAFSGDPLGRSSQKGRAQERRGISITRAKGHKGRGGKERRGKYAERSRERERERERETCKQRKSEGTTSSTLLFSAAFHCKLLSSFSFLSALSRPLCHYRFRKAPAHAGAGGCLSGVPFRGSLLEGESPRGGEWRPT